MKQHLVEILGVLTLTCSYLLKLIGFPTQIRQIIKTKSKGNITFTFIGISFVGYILWTTYGIAKGDYVVVFGHGVGIIVSGATLFFMFKYHDKNER